MRKRPDDAIAMTPDNPQSAVYMLARREWNERYGSYIAQRDGWRMAALAALGVAALAVGGLIYDRSRGYVVPYIVEVDKLGDALAIARADVAAPVAAQIIRAQLARWIVEVRSVYMDVAAQRRLIEDAYAMLDRHGAAFQTANEWFEANDPFKRAANELVGVQVESVLPISANTWRIEWREETRSRDGTLLSRQPWQAVATVNVIPPTTDAAMLVNPTGLFVEAFSWTPRQ
jgi:Type IV secretory pathway, TrbF components